MSRSRHDREWDHERKRGRESDRKSVEHDRQREYEKKRGRDVRSVERDRDRERERERDVRSAEKDRERDRDRERARSREKGRQRGREVSRERESGPRQQQRKDRDDGRHDDDARTGFGGAARSPESPALQRPRHRGDGDRVSRHSNTEREVMNSPPRQGVGAAVNEDQMDVSADRPSNDDPVSKMEAAQAALEAKEKEKAQPTFEYSGKLAAETNKVRGVTLAFIEPPEARKPSTRWRLYVFKDGEPLNDPLYIHRQTCYLFGRERRVADIPTDHPSCSKQHSVIQYRLTEKEGPDGMMASKVRPYVMDLGSTNGTFLNGTRIEAQRYYELMEKDTIKFGNSSREYVLLHENSNGT